MGAVLWAAERLSAGRGSACKVRAMERTLIIIPTYNESENLPSLCEQIHKVLPAADVLVVDDNSPDGTGQLADALSQEHAFIKVIHRAGKLGLGTAYLEGFRYALDHNYDYIFEMDADFSHDPSYLPSLLGAAIEGADVVIGSRRVTFRAECPAATPRTGAWEDSSSALAAACTRARSWGFRCAT